MATDYGSFAWPTTESGSNPSVGLSGNPAPTSATEIGGVDLAGNLIPVSVDSSGNVNTNVISAVLPTNAATASNQVIQEATLTAIEANQTNGTQVTSVNNFPATQPVSGTVTVVQTTGSNLHADIDSSALPTGASTSALQTTGNTSLGTIVSQTASLPTSLGQKTMAESLPVVIASDQSAIPISGTVTATNPSVGVNGSAVPLDSTQIGGSDGTNLRALSVNSSGVLALPQGAATSANQATEITSLGTIVTNTGNIPANGQKVSASSLPVVIASDQSAVPVSGTLQTKAPLNANASGSAAGATVSTVTTLTAPANAVGFILMNLDTSTTNMRWAIGRTAATNLGQQLQPGRSSDFVQYTGNVSIIAESGTCNFDIQWISQ